MRKITLVALTTTALVAACSPPQSETSGSAEAPNNEFGFMEAMEQPSILPAVAPPPPATVERVTAVDIEEPAEGVEEANLANDQVPEGMPQIAYRYDYGFRVEGDILNTLQQQHADLCASKGSNVCRIISLNQSDASGAYGYGHLQIEVVADQARDFGKELVSSTEGAGGEQVSASITGEDLSKKIVDTEARLRARTLLRDRLMDVLRSRRGTVAELVEAERGVAQVNEEIDQARSWLAEMRGRVAFSDISITYQTGDRAAGSTTPRGFWGPVSWALGSAGAALGSAIATIIMIIASLLPWLLTLAGLFWAWRKAGLPFWKRKKKPYASEAAALDSEAEEAGS